MFIVIENVLSLALDSRKQLGLLENDWYFKH